MGPAVLITLGALFLVDNLDLNGLSFHNTWPLLLIVIGIVKVLQYTAPIEGHRMRGTETMVTPPPARPAGELPPQSPTSGGGQGVNNG
jgi:Domain of unknown function (DUF5668)